MASQQTVVLMKTSWRCLPSLSSEDVFKTSWSNSLQSYVFKTSWSRPIFSPWPYVFKTFDKVKPSRSGTSLKMSLERRCFLVKSAKFVETAFLQNTTGRLLLIIAVSIVVKGELANETVNYDSKRYMYQSEPAM